MTAAPRTDGPWQGPPATYGIVPGQFAEPPLRTAPGLGLIIAITVIFGLAGIIPAAVRARRAENSGLPSGRYWKAFGITFAVMAALSVLAGAAVTRMVDAAAPAITAESLAQSLVEHGSYTDADGTAAAPASATCAPVQVDGAGAGTWRCTVDVGAEQQSYQLTVDPDGQWVID